MDREWLAGRLEAGDSIEAIAREVGRHPSTVAYWMQNYGLVSSYAERHAARGGLAREVLEDLVFEGLSTRGIATRLGCSQATVRHWLNKYGIETRRTSRLKATREGRADRLDATIRVCDVHAETTFVLDQDGYYRCSRCRADSVVRRRARMRARLIADAGGRCSICGYDRDPSALQFHHVNPATKTFTIRNGHTRSLQRMQAEVAKCVLLCANCHAEVGSGTTELPVPSAERVASGVAQTSDPG